MQLCHMESKCSSYECFRGVEISTRIFAKAAECDTVLFRNPSRPNADVVPAPDPGYHLISFKHLTNFVCISENIKVAENFN